MPDLPSTSGNGNMTKGSLSDNKSASTHVSTIRKFKLRDKFQVVMRHKDVNNSNLSKKFESYGCNTLEARIPVVKSPIADALQGTTPNEALMETLRLKQMSASNAMDGRRPRTKNAQLRIVDINGEKVIAASECRERSPVERDQLDSEIDEYMREAARIKEMKQKDTETTSRIVAALTMDDDEACMETIDELDFLAP